MRTLIVSAVGALALAVAGCGGGSYANNPRPAVPVNVTAYISSAAVQISPTSLGAGPVVFIVTNQSGASRELRVESAGSSSSSCETSGTACSGPINPQGTAQVKVDLRPGDYRVSAGDSLRAASIHVGPPRPSAQNQVLQP
jgi:hypothetical protein